MKTVYEPHPVSPERKTELRAKGFKIVDIRFAPVDEVVDVGPDIVPETADDNDPLGFDSGEQFSDEELRDAIKEASGRAPGPRSSRETLINRFNELNAA